MAVGGVVIISMQSRRNSKKEWTHIHDLVDATDQLIDRRIHGTCRCIDPTEQLVVQCILGLNDENVGSIGKVVRSGHRLVVDSIDGNLAEFGEDTGQALVRTDDEATLVCSYYNELFQMTLGHQLTS